MKLVLEKEDLSEYLKLTEEIDYGHKRVKKVANLLSEGLLNEIEIAKNVYNYVRDLIAHSADINGNVVTCKASEVLEQKHGICYAKSHLLAAILRCLGIPTGFCYQHLILNDEEKPWIILHGLNAIYLKSLDKWVRVDARGNKQGVGAEFCIDSEKLAFQVREELGEQDNPVIYANPSENTVKALKESKSVAKLLENLPKNT